MIRKLCRSALVVAGIGAATAAGVAVGETVQVGNLILTADASFKPTTLPKNEMAPISLSVEAHVATQDGAIPPIAKSVVIDFDKNGTVVTKGVDTCDPKKLQNTTTSQAKKKCKSAIVGSGETRAIIDFPDQEPFEARGPLVAFNGKPQGKNPMIVFHVLANVPLPTTFVVPAPITRSPKSGFGKRLTAQIPPIAGGNGTLTDFDVTIDKKPATGKEYLLARCKDKKFDAEAQVTMLSGEQLNLSVVRDCKPK